MNIPYVFKRCTKCGEIKLATTEYFSKKKGYRFGLYSQCKVCEQKYSKQWRQDNKEYSKQWCQDNKEYLKEYDKQWYQDNKERKQEYIKEYNKTPQGQITAFNAHQRRRSKEAALGNGITVEQWQECMQFFNWKCAYSGKPLKEGNRSLDHVTPLNLGGENEIWNVVPMHRNYNSSKQDKEMEEWYKEQEFYSEERLQKIYEWQEYTFNKWSLEEIVNE